MYCCRSAFATKVQNEWKHKIPLLSQCFIHSRNELDEFPAFFWEKKLAHSSRILMHSCCCCCFCYNLIPKPFQEALTIVLIEPFDCDIVPQFSHAISFFAFVKRFKCVFFDFAANSLANNQKWNFLLNCSDIWFLCLDPIQSRHSKIYRYEQFTTLNYLLEINTAQWTIEKP